MNVFIDTSYFIARANPRDQRHRRAVAANKPNLTFVTSSAVANETISLLQARGFLDAALVFLVRIQDSSGIEIVYPDAVLQQDAWNLFRTLARPGANGVDCLSFAIMKRRGIRRAFAFDEHFRSAGFLPL